MKKLIFLLLLILFVSGCTGKVVYETTSKATVKEGPFLVTNIVDGDTFDLNNSERVRLSGINTPETGECYYQEAKDFLKQVENEDIEILRYWEDLGKYKRKLRYIFYKNRLINIELLEQGLAKAFIIEDLKYKDKILKAENYAKENCLRLWEDG